MGLSRGEQAGLEEADFYAAKMTLLQAPKHGVLGLGQTGGAYVVNVPNFEGPDQSTLLVEIGGYKVTVKYFFKVMKYVPSGTQSDPYLDKNNCPNGTIWKISLNPDDPNALIYTFEHPYQLTNALAGVVQANLTFSVLPGSQAG